MSDEENIPFDEGDDDFQLESRGVADGRTFDTIVDESTFPPVPRGKNLYYVKKVSLRTKDTNGKPAAKPFKVYLADDAGGFTREVTYLSHEVEVTFALVDDPRLTIRGIFRLPPATDDPEENDGYLWGISDTVPEESRKEKRSPFHFNNLRHVLHQLGFRDGEEGQLPEDATTLGNWRTWPDGSPRQIILDVVDQTKNVRGDDGKWKKEIQTDQNGKPYSSIAMFGYDMADDTKDRLGSAPVQPEKPAPAAKPSPPAAKPPAKPAPPAASKPAPPAKPSPPGGVKPPAKRY